MTETAPLHLLITFLAFLSIFSIEPFVCYSCSRRSKHHLCSSYIFTKKLRLRNHLLADFVFDLHIWLRNRTHHSLPHTGPSYEVCVGFQTWRYHMFSCWYRLTAFEIQEEACVAVEESSHVLGQRSVVNLRKWWIHFWTGW